MAQSSPPAADKPKGFWGTIVTTTPVVLTLLSTLLAGVSSSQMIRAQYYRSLAAQYQSKAGDQWNFFQAKRIRNTVIEQDLDRRQARPYPIKPAHVEAALERLAAVWPTQQQQADHLVQVVGTANDAGPVGSSLHEAVRRLADATREGAAESPKAQGDAVRAVFGKDAVRAAFAYLGTDRLPGEAQKVRKAPKVQKSDATPDDPIAQALAALREMRPEREIADLVYPIDEDRLREAVEAAEARAKAVETQGKEVEDALRPLDELLDQFERRAYYLRRAAADVEAVLRESGDRAKVGDDVRRAVADVAGGVLTMERHLQTLQDYKVARKDFTARRYDREARFNQQVAGPYELRVYKNSAVSDRHRERSQQFFYAMLMAQGGAALGALAMAGRRKGLLWFLAFLAGLAAVLYSAYVALPEYIPRYLN